MPLVETLASWIALLGGAAASATWGRRRIANRLRVKRVTHETDTDLDPALDLYEQRLPVTVRDRSDDIKRWLAENRLDNATSASPLAIYVYIAIHRHRPCAFFYAEYYRLRRMLLISYLVTSKDLAGKRASKRIAQRLFRDMRKAGCRLVVFEQEVPASHDTSQWLARWRRFEQLSHALGVSIGRLDLRYVQPKLSLKPHESEQPQYLFYMPLDSGDLEAAVPKQRVTEILDTVYNDWYAGSFEDDLEYDRDYRAYVRTVFDRVSASLSDPVKVAIRPLPRDPSLQ